MDIDAALDDIERVVVDGDMRQEARAKACEQLEALTVEFARLRNDYAVFEELAPPDMPRKDFANRCFDAWNMLAPGAELEVSRLRSILGDLQKAIVNEQPYSVLFDLTEKALGTDTAA